MGVGEKEKSDASFLVDVCRNSCGRSTGDILLLDWRPGRILRHKEYIGSRASDFATTRDQWEEGESHSGSFLLNEFCSVRGLDLSIILSHVCTLARHHAQELGLVRVIAVIVRGADADQLLESPSIRHGGDHLSQLILVTLEDTVHMLLRLAALLTGLLVRQSHFAQFDELGDIVEFSLFQNSCF